MGKHINEFVKGRAIEMLKNGISKKEIAKRLKTSRTSIRRWNKRFIETGRVQRKKGSGRKTSLDQRIKRRMVRWLIL